MRRKKVSIILPALNEQQAVGKVIDEIPKRDMEERGYQVEIQVVDNGSTDKTREIAENKGVKVIVEPMRGKGRAVRTAFKSVDGDFVFVLDADYTYPAIHIPQMLEILEEGFDVVMGSRLKGQREEGAMSKLNLIGNRLLAFMANILYGTRISDLCTGYLGFRREVIQGLKLEAMGFELEANLFIEITKKGYKIAELPIVYRRRLAPAKLDPLKDGFRIGWTLIKKRFR